MKRLARGLRRTSSAQRRAANVLLVEDDPAIADMYAMHLRAAGWAVRIAADGLQALQAAWQDQPAMVLLDVQLPQLDGLTVMEHLGRLPAADRPAVIMLSNSATAEVVERALRAGAHEFLCKATTTPGQLLGRVAEVLGRASAPRTAALAAVRLC